MLSEAVPHDFRFNQHIFQTGMAFLEVVVAGDIPPQDFRSLARCAVGQGVAILGTELLIGGHFADNILRHLHNVPDFHAVKGEPVTPLGSGAVSLSDTQGVIIKAGIIGGYLSNAILLDDFKHGLPDFIGACHNALTGSQFLDIAGDFPVIVSGTHKVTLVTENIPIHIGSGFVNRALGVNYRPAAIIDKDIGHIHFAVLCHKGVGGFGINYQNIVLAMVNHNLSNPFCS